MRLRSERKDIEQKTERKKEKKKTINWKIYTCAGTQDPQQAQILSQAIQSNLPIAVWTRNQINLRSYYNLCKIIKMAIERNFEQHTDYLIEWAEILTKKIP